MHTIKWKLENRKLSTLTPYEKNPRIIKGKGFDDLKKSLDEFGLATPLVINTDGVIVGGHARYNALIEVGEEFADCYVPDVTLTPEQVSRLNIRLNRIAGQWDFEVLSSFFEEEELKDLGFDEHEFGKFDFGDEEEQGNLGKKSSKEVECPECGHVFIPKKKKESEAD